jgi:hypothetical protein
MRALSAAAVLSLLLCLAPAAAADDSTDDEGPVCDPGNPLYADDYHGRPYLCVVGIPVEGACHLKICGDIIDLD